MNSPVHSYISVSAVSIGICKSLIINTIISNVIVWIIIMLLVVSVKLPLQDLLSVTQIPNHRFLTHKHIVVFRITQHWNGSTAIFILKEVVSLPRVVWLHSDSSFQSTWLTLMFNAWLYCQLAVLLTSTATWALVRITRQTWWKAW